MSSLSFLLLVLLFFATILVSSTSYGNFMQPKSKKHVALFVFGDSLYDPGNNNYLNISINYRANYPPYGETFFRYPTGRHCDGRTIADFFAGYNNLPLLEPYMQPGSSHHFTDGSNFASAGSAVLEINHAVLNLREQLRNFKKVVNFLRQNLGDAEAKNLLMQAVYLFGVGGNDVTSFFSDGPNATESVLEKEINMVMGNLTNVIKEIYEIGGRKFAFQNLFPLGCAPRMKDEFNISGDGCVEELSALARQYNSALSNAIKKLESQLPGFKYSIFDVYSALDDIIKNPSKYGFKVVSEACCGIGANRGSNCGIKPYELCDNPNEYVFFDGGHPTEHANSQLTKLIWNGAPNVTWPLNMKQLYELEPVIEMSSEDDSQFSDA